MPPQPRSKKAASAEDAPPPSGEPRVFLLVGTEAARKSAEAQALLKRHVDPDFADFDAETMDGSNAAADRALGGVATVPMGIGKRVVLVRDTQQMDAEEQKKLAAGLAKVPSSGVLILHTGTPIVEEGKTKRASVVATELLNAVKKAGGTVIEFALPKAGGEDVRAWAQREAKSLGKSLAPDALALLTALPEGDVGRMGTEVAKAAAHAGDNQTITGADVEAVLSRGPDDVIFKLCDAVGARKTREALGHVSTLFKGGGRPESVAPRALVLLARQVRLLAQFHYLGRHMGRGRGAPPPSGEVLALFPSDGAAGMLANPRMSWMADKYVAQARNFSGGELAERMEKLLQADLALKGAAPGGDSPQAVLQRLVVELC